MQWNQSKVLIFIGVAALNYLLWLSSIANPLKALFKIVPILILQVYVLQYKLDCPTKTILSCALGSSILGDIALTYHSKYMLQLGITAFMITHAMYLILFSKNRIYSQGSVNILIFLLCCALGCVSYLWPYLGEMRYIVLIYVGLLLSMVFSSFQVMANTCLITSGACLFLVSDFIVGLEVFVFPAILTLQVLSVLTYYGAQTMLIIGITHNCRRCLKFS